MITSAEVPKYGFMPSLDAQQERLELLATVVDHLAPAGLADGRVAGRSGRGCAGWARIGSRWSLS